MLMAESTPLSAADVQARLLQGPYHQWLGLQVTALGEGKSN